MTSKLKQRKNTHTHTHLTALFPGLPGSAGTRKVKLIWISVNRKTVSGSGISWAICKSAPCSRQITTPAPYNLVFTGRMPFLPPNSAKALKARALKKEDTFRPNNLNVSENIQPNLMIETFHLGQRQTLALQNVGGTATYRDLMSCRQRRRRHQSRIVCRAPP